MYWACARSIDVEHRPTRSSSLPLWQGGRGEREPGNEVGTYDSSEIKQSCVGRSKSYSTYFHLGNWPVITVIFLGNLERVSAKTFATDLQVIYIWLVPSFQGYSLKFLVKQSRQWLIGYPKTSKFVKNIRCASYFQLSSRCLDIGMKHCLSCLIYNFTISDMSQKSIFQVSTIGARL